MIGQLARQIRLEEIMPSTRPTARRPAHRVGPPEAEAQLAAQPEAPAKIQRPPLDSPEALRGLAERVVELYNRDDQTSIGQVAEELGETRTRISRALASVGLATPGKGRRAAGFRLHIPTQTEIEEKRAQERILETSPEVLATMGTPVTFSITLGQLVEANRTKVIDILVAGLDGRVAEAVRMLLG